LNAAIPVPKEAQKMKKQTLFEIGGYAATVILVAFGIAALVMGVNGRSTVNSNLKQEQIYGSGDMTPAAISGEVKAARDAQTKLVSSLQGAGVKITPSPISTPSCSVAGKFVNTGSRARCFAEYMRIHTFGATSGLTYSQMGRFAAKPDAPLKATDGLGGTNDPKYALADSKTHQPVANGRRDIWVTYTALTTALNSAYMADQLSLFGVVVGVALLLAGLGFGVLAFAVYRLPALSGRQAKVARPAVGVTPHAT
jgi:hypothetical protein